VNLSNEREVEVTGGALVALHDEALAVAVIAHLERSGIRIRARELADAIGGPFAGVAADVPAATGGPMDWLANAVPTVDVLVVDAPQIPGGRFLEATESEMRRLVGDGLVRTTRLIQAVGARMVEQESGRIIYVARSGAVGVVHERALHAMIDAALVRLCMALAGEWATLGIRVNVVAAGQLASDPDAADATTARIPMRRLGQADEVAKLVTHLATGVDFLTGGVIAVDGGVSARS
jgi:NAD(P)-dependent dehydrogenase (short-subunit alcohol dehydrogenase family)